MTELYNIDPDNYLRGTVLPGLDQRDSRIDVELFKLMTLRLLQDGYNVEDMNKPALFAAMLAAARFRQQRAAAPQR